MGILISKTDAGSVKIYYDTTYSELYNNLTDVSITPDVAKQAVKITWAGMVKTISVASIESINGAAPPTDLTELITLLADTVFNFGGGGGEGPSGGVESVTGNIVSGTSKNPIVNIPSGDNRKVLTYDADGNLLAARIGWSQLSDLPTPPPFLNGVLIGTAFKPNGDALFGFLEMALDEDAQSKVLPNAFPVYNPGIVGNGGGTIPVANGVNPNDAINVGQLTTTTTQINTSLSGKVDKVAGKGLSTNDFDAAARAKLNSMVQYDDRSLKATIDSKVDKVEGRSLSEANYSIDEKAKLAGLSNFDSQPILTALDNKVDKITNMGLSATSYTQAEKTKLASIIDHFAGRFNSLVSLNAVTGNTGSYAYVSINGAPTVIYAWNSTNSSWESSAAAATEESPETIKTKYESNPDTNVFSDAQKAKLASLITDATKNDTDANLRSRATHTGVSPLSSIDSLPLIINAINTTNDSQTTAINSHLSNLSNPHQVTKAQVGLGNVDNTSDANKPIPTSVITALANKEPANNNIQVHIAKSDNPHGVTKVQVGLSNVDNTSDLNKPVSNATQIALNAKANLPNANRTVSTRNENGVSSELAYATTNSNGSIPVRNEVGNFQVSAPVGNNDVVNKAYADKAGLISKTTSSAVTVREFTDRFEYTSKSVINSLSIPAPGTAYPTTSYLPTGVTIAGCDELSCTQYSASTGRYIYIGVRDGSDRRIVVEFGNLTSASITWSGTVFVKLVKYK